MWSRACRHSSETVWGEEGLVGRSKETGERTIRKELAEVIILKTLFVASFILLSILL